MRRTWILLPILAATGCGGTVGADHQRPKPATDARALSADGMSIELPDGWNARILIGASGRPVLHAASYAVDANDTDEGEIAQEAMGINGMYLNVRDLGEGDATNPLPVRFEASDFAPSPPSRGPHQQAQADVSSGGERFRITAISGGDGSPRAAYLDQLNAALGSLQLTAYRPELPTAATGDPIAGFGLHANVPDGWQGGIGRDEVHAGDSAVDLAISEYSNPDAASSFVTGTTPLVIGPAEFVSQQGGTGYETGRTFIQAGRDFQLWVRTPDGDPGTLELDRINAFLASFRAEPGDFYPGEVDPATFAPSDGWSTGSTGPAKIHPDGEQTMSWASTVPYRDSGFQFPPSQTLAVLPPDGVVLTVQLQQYDGKGGSPLQLPLRLSDFEEASFEGMSSAYGPRSYGGRYGNYDVTAWALFGREHPTQEQLDAAQAELERLHLPAWPAWDAASSAAR